MRYFACVLIPILFTACVYGPKTEKKTSWDRFNGENFEADHTMGGGNVLIVPVLKTKKRSTDIVGRVVITEGIVEIPLKLLPLELVNPDGKIVQEAKSDLNGDFRLSGYFVNGRYVIRVKSLKYSGEQTVFIDKYVIDGITLKAKVGQDKPAPMPASVAPVENR